MKRAKERLVEVKRERDEARSKLDARDRELARLSSDTIAALKEAHLERDEARVVLRRLQWSGEKNPHTCTPTCPRCHADEGTLHDHDCDLAKAIGAPRDEAPQTGTTPDLFGGGSQ